MKECNVLHNRCDCVNRVHRYANEVVYRVLSGLSEGFKLTNSYQLYSKDKERLQSIIDSFEPKQVLSAGSSGSGGSRAYLGCDEYNITLEITDNYPVRYHNDGSGGHTCEYYKKTVYLWNHKDDGMIKYKPLPIHTHGEFEEASTRLASIEAEISGLQSELYAHKRLLGK